MLMHVRSFARLDPSVIDLHDSQTAELSQAVVSEDQVSAVSVKGFEKRAVKEKDIESLVTRESSIISWDTVALDSKPERVIPSDVRIRSDKLW